MNLHYSFQEISKEENIYMGFLKLFIIYNNMYIAMNRFKIIKGKEELFEEIWKNRESDLNNIKGFLEFHLIKGSKTMSILLCIS